MLHQRVEAGVARDDVEERFRLGRRNAADVVRDVEVERIAALPFDADMAHALFVGPGQVHRRLQGRQRPPRVAAGGGAQELAHRQRHLGVQAPQAALGVAQGAVDKHEQRGVVERLQRQHPAPREQRARERKRRVFGRRADQDDRARLRVRQERILLALAVAMDLINEEHRALAALDKRLVRRELGLIQLFDPPLDASAQNPGYVKGYVPGVRENGGQYTHAAVWAVMAFAAAGDVERAWELFGLINPVHHGDSEAAIATYKVEPYVVAADVYTNPQHQGRGGWTWYTGSAGWMYRLITESLLGLRLEVDKLHLAPLIPSQWEAFDLHYRHHQTTYHIHIRNRGRGRAVQRVVCDGAEQPDKTIPLRNDGQEHRAEVEVGGG